MQGFIDVLAVAICELMWPSGSRGISLDSVTLFHDALQGLRFLHSHGWAHLDIKPHNIGVLTHPLRAVLLDLGQLSTLPVGYTLTATPGCTGTINYLSPEREMDEYDHGADIWPYTLPSVSPWRGRL